MKRALWITALVFSVVITAIVGFNTGHPMSPFLQAYAGIGVLILFYIVIVRITNRGHGVDNG